MKFPRDDHVWLIPWPSDLTPRMRHAFDRLALDARLDYIRAMGNRDPGVDAYIAKSAEFAKPILNKIRTAVHAACPEADETLKWGFPHFMYGKRILCSMAAFKAHCSFGFWDKLRETASGPGTERQSMGQFGRITRVSDLPNDREISRMVKEAMSRSTESAGAGAKSSRKPAKELPVPEVFLRALKKRKEAFAFFESLPPSHRNEYVEWITEAKSDNTREKRMATAVEWLSEEKRHNWKYERK